MAFSYVLRLVHHHCDNSIMFAYILQTRLTFFSNVIKSFYLVNPFLML